MSRLTSTTTSYTFDSAGAYTVQYGYDAASNRTSMTDPQSVPTTYGGWPTLGSRFEPGWPILCALRKGWGFPNADAVELRG